MIVGDLFNQSSESLIERYQNPTADSLLQSTQENIVAVLYHRSDKAARNFVKQFTEVTPVKAIEMRRKRNAAILKLLKRGLDLKELHN